MQKSHPIHNKRVKEIHKKRKEAQKTERKQREIEKSLDEKKNSPNDDFIAFDFSDEEKQVTEEISRGKKRRREDDSPEKNSAPLSLDILTPLPTPPWARDKHYSDDSMKMLNQEIHDYVQYMTPTKEEHTVRTLVVARIEAIATKLFPHSQVQVFGSFDTKLYLPSSDIDIVILSEDPFPRNALWTLASRFEKHKIASKIEVIDKARVPIIKLVDALSGFNVDISLNIRGGIDSAEMVKQFLKDEYCGEAMKALILVIKQFLLQRYLNEVYTGGLGSYALVIMIACFLKLHPMLQTRQMKVSRNLGVLLLEFLEFYGTALNYTEVGLSVDLDGAFLYSKKAKGMFMGDRAGALSIQDPLDRSNDISRGSYAIHVVRQAFAKAHIRMTLIIAEYENRMYEYDEWVDDYERRKTNKKPIRPRKLNTILGSILTINKAVVEHRDEIQEVYEKLMNETDGDISRLDVLTMKRSSGNSSFLLDLEKKTDKEVVYQADSTDDESLAILEDNAKSNPGSVESDNDFQYGQDYSIEDAIEDYKRENSVSEDYSDSHASQTQSIVDLTDEGDITKYYNFI